MCLCTWHSGESQICAPALQTKHVFNLPNIDWGKCKEPKDCRCTEVGGQCHSAQPKSCCNASVRALPINFAAN